MSPFILIGMRKSNLLNILSGSVNLIKKIFNVQPTQSTARDQDEVKTKKKLTAHVRSSVKLDVALSNMATVKLQFVPKKLNYFYFYDNFAECRPIIDS